MLYTATLAEIRDEKITDIYFKRTGEVLKHEGLSQTVSAEVRTVSLPSDWKWGILAGIEELVSIFEGKPVDIEALPEGSLFYPFEPVVEIRGKYLDFANLETALLGVLCQASGIATKAARFRKLAGKRKLLSFGARRMHPAIAPMIDRSAFIGGCDGVAVIKSAQLLGEKPIGTIPHALILLIGDTVEATQAFDKWMPPEIKRIALIDTFGDEKFETLRVAEALKRKLFGVRFDTPSSRRGNLLELLKECRWELTLRGFKEVKFVVSGGIDEAEIKQLNPEVDIYGIGTSLSNAPVINFSFDIVEIEGKAIAKRGKKAGRKKIYQCQKCGKRIVLPKGISPPKCCHQPPKSIRQLIMKNGKVLISLPSPQKIREYVLKQLEKVAIE
jgi:nicotinate phosphoribosyltransferase